MSPNGGRARVVVVGGGVVGRSLLRALALVGFEATLVADGGPAASSVPVALLNPHRGRTGRAHPDDLVALAATWRWAAALEAEGFTTGAHRTGAVRVADGPKQARAFAVAGLAPTDAARAGVRAPFGAFRIPEGGWLAPTAWLAALSGSAVAHGARCVEGRSVVDAERIAGGGWRLHLSTVAAGAHGDAGGTRGCPSSDGLDADRLDADHVVFATGAAPWPAALAAVLGAAPAVERTAGDVVVTRHVAPASPIAGGTYVGPVERGGERVAAIGGHHRTPGPPSGDAAARLRAAARWVLPDLDRSDPEDRLWWGVRAKRPGLRPEVHALAPGVRWVGGFAGRGFLAAASVAETLAATLAVEAGLRPEAADRSEGP